MMMAATTETTLAMVFVTIHTVITAMTRTTMTMATL